MAADSGLPVKDVTVTIFFGTAVAGEAVTGSNGAFTVFGLSTGVYKAKFTPPVAINYQSEWYNDKTSGSLADPISVVTASTTLGVNAILALGARITGRVTASDTGDPLPGVTVNAYSIEGALVATASTDVDGNYVIHGLSTDSHKLRFDPRGSYDQMTALYVGEYYNDKPEFTAADPVAVTAPATTADINVALARGATITGIVMAADSGLPLGGVDVEAIETAGTYSAYSPTDDEGRYTLVVRSGSHRVYFGAPFDTTYASEYYNDKVSRNSADFVTTTAPDVTPKIDAILSQGGLIAGRVTDAQSGAGLDSALVAIYDAGTGDEINISIADVSGYYTATQGLRSGAYKVGFDAPSYAPRFFSGKASLAIADPVNVTAPSITANINAALAQCRQSAKVLLPIIIH